MKRHFDDSLADLRQRILRMGALVEGQIRQALIALVDRDDLVANQVIQNDRQVNTMDVAIDELCLELLALHQPAAKDLRFVTTAMKISTELERMSDLAENICERAL
ncbi:MAG: PhoU domain-containing protein, partial [Nitrospirales bacterium]